MIARQPVLVSKRFTSPPSPYIPLSYFSFFNILSFLGNNLPWSPTISTVYSSLAGPLRVLFQEFIQNLKAYNILKQATDKKSRQQIEKLAYDIQILTDLIHLFNVDPNLALFPLVCAATITQPVKIEIVGAKPILNGLKMA